MPASIENIVIKGDPLRKEELSSAAVTPGDLIEFDANGYVQRHANAGQNAVPRFAVEEDLLGDDISDNYASGDRVQYVVARPGDEIYALLASGQSVSKGDSLESAGNGSLRAHTVPSGTAQIYVRSIVAVAAEDKDNSGGDANGPHNNAARFIVEVV